MKIETERSYDIIGKAKTSPRFLVDRLWPRGIKKEVLQLDLWIKELSPSDRLRKWYNHDRQKWEEFKDRYFKELNDTPEEMRKFLANIKNHKEITLVYSSTEKEINNAVALKEYLLHHLK
jgi:uncharacterized protein YeaO (DUF488 family)